MTIQINSIRREIDLLLFLRIECEKTGKTILAGLHTARIMDLVSRLERLA